MIEELSSHYSPCRSEPSLLPINPVKITMRETIVVPINPITMRETIVVPINPITMRETIVKELEMLREATVLKMMSI